ncbi:MAG: hypothetical protein ACE5K0_04585 [Candidatus Methanofastidiosia archaeon]
MKRKDGGELLKKVERKLVEMECIKDLRFLSEEERKEVSRLENFKGSGRFGMDLLNEGISEVLKREFVLVILVDEKEGFREPQELMLIVDEKRNVIGEWLSKDRIKEVRNRENVFFLSSDFVIYTDVKPHGRSYFLIPPLGFPELSGIEDIENLVSTSPSLHSDSYLKKLLNSRDSDFSTILIGFDSKRISKSFKKEN